MDHPAWLRASKCYVLGLRGSLLQEFLCHPRLQSLCSIFIGAWKSDWPKGHNSLTGLVRKVAHSPQQAEGRLSQTLPPATAAAYSDMEGSTGLAPNEGPGETHCTKSAKSSAKEVPRCIWIGSTGSPIGRFSVTRGGQRSGGVQGLWMDGLEASASARCHSADPKLPVVEGLQDEIHIQTVWLREKIANLYSMVSWLEGSPLDMLIKHPVRCFPFQ